MCPGDSATMVAKPIKVVQMLPGLESGGVEQGTLELGAYLSKQGHRSLVISQGGQMVPRLESQGSTHITWRYIGEKSPRCLPYIFPLRRILREVDILHLRSRLPAWVAYLAWKSLPQAERPRLVTTFHGFYSINKYSAIMAKGEKVIAVSKTISNYIKETYGVEESRIQIIYRGFDEAVFKPGAVSSDRIEALQKDWDLPPTTHPIILLPGRVTRLKGHDIFFKSLSNIRHLPWTAICVGEIDETSAHTPQLRKQLNDLDLADRIKLVGHCNDMAAALMLSDIVVSSSTQPESFGRIAVEAQAMGKPVIATAHGGSLETIIDQKTGWLVKPGDADVLAEALGKAISDPVLREQFGENGQQWVGENFSTQKMCEETIELYKELL
jgi:glycosyltransferase involved in cell wall biosynthesis